MANIKVAIINASTVIKDADLLAAVKALQIQVTRDFAPPWGVDADLIFVPKGSKAPGGKTWWLAVLDNTDEADALGYHDLTPQGRPIGKVFAKTDIDSGASWTNTLSHELLEMLADPDINLTVLVEEESSRGRLYAYEVCDACEDDSLGYKINGILVSDFVYPEYFESSRKKGSAQFDYGKHISQPFQILKGGYLSIFDIGSGNGWQQITARKANCTYAMRPRIGSRRERRRTLRDQWMKSDPKASTTSVKSNATTASSSSGKARVATAGAGSAAKRVRRK